MDRFVGRNKGVVALHVIARSGREIERKGDEAIPKCRYI